MYGRLKVNVALNRPTFSSSVYVGVHGAYPPSIAVDGNKDTASNKPDSSCFNSDFQADPWWSVDLGAAVVVVGVLFTNRAEGLGNCRLSSITI